MVGRKTEGPLSLRMADGVGLPLLASSMGLLLSSLIASPLQTQQSPASTARKSGLLFQTSERCMPCHNGLSAPSGEDVSIGFNWRPSMMANSSRDPYWQAAVRREIMDHPKARARHRGRVCNLPHADGSL